jgi:hypothetical protein
VKDQRTAEAVIQKFSALPQDHFVALPSYKHKDACNSCKNASKDHGKTVCKEVAENPAKSESIGDFQLAVTGKHKRGESVEDAHLREIAEEIGVNARYSTQLADSKGKKSYTYRIYDFTRSLTDFEAAPRSYPDDDPDRRVVSWIMAPSVMDFSTRKRIQGSGDVAGVKAIIVPVHVLIELIKVYCHAKKWCRRAQ